MINTKKTLDKDKIEKVVKLTNGETIIIAKEIEPTYYSKKRNKVGKFFKQLKRT